MLSIDITRCMRQVAVAGALAVLAAPAARAGHEDVGVRAALDRAAATTSAETRIYEGLDPALRAALLSRQAESRRFGDDLNGSRAIEPTSQPTVPYASARGFDWFDAGVVAAASTAAAMLLALAAVAVFGRRAPGRV